MSFALHPRLAGDTVHVGDMLLSRVLLMNDARFPWLVLVPRRPGLSEIIDMAAGERAMLMEEIAAVSSVLKDVTLSPKLNVAALGNLVPQLHVHVVARFASDAAWPGPVWGHGKQEAYVEPAGKDFAAQISQRLPSV